MVLTSAAVTAARFDTLPVPATLPVVNARSPAFAVPPDTLTPEPVPLRSLVIETRSVVVIDANAPTICALMTAMTSAAVADAGIAKSPSTKVIV